MNEITIDYELTRPTVIKGAIAMLVRRPLTAVVSILAGIPIGWHLWQQDDGIFYAIACVSTAVLFTVGIYLIQLAITLAIVTISVFRNTTPGVFTRHVITANDAGIIEETTVNKTETNWHGITKIWRTSNLIFLQIGPHQSHLIPKYAFADETAFARFYQDLLHLKQHATSSPERDV